MIEIKPAGQTAPKVEKFAQESILYVLNCVAILEPNEIIIKATLAPQQGLEVVSIRSKKGNTVHLLLSNDPLGTSQYVDYNIRVNVTTNTGSLKIANFILRVHK